MLARVRQSFEAPLEPSPIPDRMAGYPHNRCCAGELTPWNTHILNELEVIVSAPAVLQSRQVKAFRGRLMAYEA